MNVEKQVSADTILGEMNLQDPQLLSFELHKENGNLAGSLYVEYSNSGLNWVRDPAADIVFVAGDTTLLLEVVDTPSAKARFGIDNVTGSSKVKCFGYAKGAEE